MNKCEIRNKSYYFQQQHEVHSMKPRNYENYTKYETTRSENEENYAKSMTQGNFTKYGSSIFRKTAVMLITLLFFQVFGELK